jgi:WD40 repeat protein
VVIGLGNGATKTINLDTGTAVTNFAPAHTSAVNKVLRINSQNLLTASNDTFVKLWNTSTGAYVCSYNHSSPVLSMVVLPNSLLATGTCNSIFIWNLTSSSPNRVNMSGHTGCVNDLLLQQSPSAYYIVSASSDGYVKSWDMSFKNVYTSSSFGGPMNCLAQLGTGEVIGGGPVLAIWNSVSFTQYTPLGTGASIQAMAVFADGVTIACGMSDGYLQVFYFLSKRFNKITGTKHALAVNTLAWVNIPTMNENYFLSGSDDGNTFLWYTDGTYVLYVKTFPSGTPVNSIYFLYNQITNC